MGSSTDYFCPSLSFFQYWHAPLSIPPVPADQIPFSEAYLGFEGNELQNHLHGEEASEEHVEDVHGNFEEAALAIVLRGGEGL